MDQQEIDILIKKYELSERRVCVTSNECAREVRKLALEGAFEVTKVEKHQNIYWYSDKHLDFIGSDESISTFNDFVDVTLTRDWWDGKERPHEYFVVVSVYKSGSELSTREGRRLNRTFTLKGEWWRIEALRARIEYNWEMFTLDQLEIEEGRAREARRKEIAAGILAGTYEVNKE
jgi:hypothetical protein